MNILECTQNGGAGAVKLANGSFITVQADAYADNEAVKIGIRPEHIIVANPEAGHVSGTIGVVEQLGGDTFIYVDVEGLNTVTVRIPGIAKVHEGDMIGLDFDPGQSHLFDRNDLAIATYRRD